MVWAAWDMVQPRGNGTTGASHGLHMQYLKEVRAQGTGYFHLASRGCRFVVRQK